MTQKDAMEFAANADKVKQASLPDEKKPEENLAVPKLEAIKVEEPTLTPKVKQAEEELKKESPKKTEGQKTHIFALRTTANREDQVADFIASNVKKKKIEVYTVVRPHGMRGYIFLEAKDRQAAEQAGFGVPYARGVLPKEVEYAEIEHMLEQVKREINIRKNDIVEIISGPFKREQAKIARVDKQKEEVVVELLGAAVPIPITVKMDSVKVIRRDSSDEPEEEDGRPLSIPGK